MRDRTVGAERRNDLAGDVSEPIEHELVSVAKPVLRHIRQLVLVKQRQNQKLPATRRSRRRRALRRRVW